NLPPIPELGTASGFDMMLLDRNNLGHEAMTGIRNQLLGMAAQDPRLARVRPDGLPDVPTFRIYVDYEKVKSLGINISELNQTLFTACGCPFVSAFIYGGRVQNV